MHDKIRYREGIKMSKIETPWKLTGERCPKCGGRMILNRRYEECGERNCDYIKRTIINLIVNWS